MSENIVFGLYQPSDAQEMADLYNRNRFHAARNKHMTAEDFSFIKQCRGVHFFVIAKKNGKIIGTAGVSPTSVQSVAKKNQVFIGNFLIDMRYRLSYSIIVGLFRELMEEIARRGFKEIIAYVIPENESSYHLMLKCGFVLLDSNRNDFGRVKLHCFNPALGRYTGVDGNEVDTNIFFSTLPVINKKEANKLQSKTRIHERYIECDYLFDREQVTLLYDVVNLKVDGAIASKRLKIYPDFVHQGRYMVENLQKKGQLELPVELVMEENSGLENITHHMVLEPGEAEAIECPGEVRVLKFKHSNQWFNLFPNLFEEVEVPKKTIQFKAGSQWVVFDLGTGFMYVMEEEQKLVTFPWPCITVPYMEGVIVPRVKDLSVEQGEGDLTITEDTDQYQLIRRCRISESGIKLTTTLTCKDKETNPRPISQIYANKGVVGYSVRSGNEERDVSASMLKHHAYEFCDYTYWDTEPEKYADFPVEMLSLKYPSSIVEVTLDQRGKWIDHAPMFTTTLDFQRENILEEQIIEEIEIHYRKTEEK